MTEGLCAGFCEPVGQGLQEDCVVVITVLSEGLCALCCALPSLDDKDSEVVIGFCDKVSQTGIGSSARLGRLLSQEVEALFSASDVYTHVVALSRGGKDGTSSGGLDPRF